MRVPVIAGNWKMHKTLAEARELSRAIREGTSATRHCQIALAPPYTALSTVADVIRGTPLILAAQDVFWEEFGAYTGAISLSMLEDLGCGMVIIGHSERRQYFGETDETVNRRLHAVMKSSLNPIVCIGETLAQREAGIYHEIVYQQLASGLHGLTHPDLLRIILAYEPVWAIGTGRTASPEIAQEVHGAMRAWLAEKYGEETARQIRILYGGSIKPGNISDLMRQPDIDGGLVGGACLEAESFLRIIHYQDSRPAEGR